mmetsp:Transcript_7966/g.9248  ORF Transcript_7966/g.9248 Transcript_7966/m.9248 type:complete len:88 (-) Transcript_7966:1417-1680(-)
MQLLLQDIFTLIEGRVHILLCYGSFWYSMPTYCWFLGVVFIGKDITQIQMNWNHQIHPSSIRFCCILNGTISALCTVGARFPAYSYD